MTEFTGTTAFQFNQAVGMNMHFDRTDGQWANWPFVVDLLKALNIHWVRVGASTLTNAGIRDLLHRLDDQDRQGSIRSCLVAERGISAERLHQYMQGLWGVSYFEGPNEIDINAGDTWAAEGIAAMRELFRAKQAFPGIRLIAPSVVFADPLALAEAEMINCGNMHAYYGTRMPETQGWGGDVYGNGTVYGSLAYNIAKAKRGAKDRDVIATETGYATTGKDSVGEYAQAAYLERTLLAHARAGVTRTFLYDLVDDNESFGLARLDGSLKPAAFALQGFLNILNEGVDFKSDCRVTLDVISPTMIQYYPIFKSTGEIDVVMWLPDELVDSSTGQALPERRIAASVNIDAPGTVHYYQQDASYRWTQHVNPNMQRLIVTARPSILALRASDTPKLPLLQSY